MAGHRTALKRVVIFGGYGAVGREAAGVLRRRVPEVVVAGRDLAKARGVPGAVPMRVDLRGDLDEALAGADAVVMCVDQGNARVARACFERGVHYVDVTASYGIVREIEALDAGDATGVLSVGLAPGVTNLLARLCGGSGVDIGVLLGSGERHGAAAVEWTLDALAEVGPAWTMLFPEPCGRRVVRGFPFPDQHTLPRTAGFERVRTGLCLDSRALTGLLAGPVSRLVRRPRGRALVLGALTRVHVGGEGFAVAAASERGWASFSGRRQSRASGLAAALAVRELEGMPPGVHHLDQVVEPERFLREMASYGFGFASGEYDAG
ncbi:saccharopine dehydrogenase NADP-binding domain-containing protein [Spirillospora sp. NPDC029432]|uniref:saccharopine dehydrogenase NADP-binding domain-containing protein n=1 Tax=Spirillospora sp. NPDC029432 TaxID=3154599 RepID=UPI003451A531